MALSLRVGSRPSPLALRQTGLVVAPLRRAFPSLRIEILPLRTQGDERRRPGGTRDFTDRLSRALEEREIDVAVHSAKDLPTRPVREVTLAAALRRADPRDCLVLAEARSLTSLPGGARLGSSSPRRRAQLLRARPDLRVVEMHGNVGTRVEKIASLHLDGVILAVAGLQRLGLSDRISERLPLHRFLPSPGQGVLALETRSRDRAARRIVARVNDPVTLACVAAERAFAAALGATCDTPLGAIARPVGGTLELTGELLSPDGSRSVRGRRRGGAGAAHAIGRALARDLLADGARELLPGAR